MASDLCEALRELCQDAELVVTADEFNDGKIVAPPTLAVAVADIERLLAAHPETDDGAALAPTQGEPVTLPVAPSSPALAGRRERIEGVLRFNLEGIHGRDRCQSGFAQLDEDISVLADALLTDGGVVDLGSEETWELIEANLASHLEADEAEGMDTFDMAVWLTDNLLAALTSGEQP